MMFVCFFLLLCDDYPQQLVPEKLMEDDPADPFWRAYIQMLWIYGLFFLTKPELINNIHLGSI